MQALKHDVVAFSMTNSSNITAPCFGQQRMLGTNPIAIAFPCASGNPIVIDMATSCVPFGRVEEAARKGEKLPGCQTIHRISVSYIFYMTNLSIQWAGPSIRKVDRAPTLGL